MSLETDGTIIEDQKTVANNFVNYFATVASDIGDPEILALTEEQLDTHPSIQSIKNNMRIVNGPQLEIQKFGKGEVAKVLSELNVKKAVGHDRIPYKILKMGCDELAPSLTSLYNKCIEESFWPDDWKRGEWIPVFKKDNHLDVKNYRPITLLAASDKVFEKLLSRQVTAYMEPRLSSNLTAYRKTHSTETTLISLVEKWKHAVDEKKMVGVLSTDMSKAFDSLHPPLLLSKLKAYGFSESAINLLRSYFNNRKCRVKISSETTSDWKDVLRGCPQGSTFGPLLWNIFQNDMTHIISKCNLTMYADDHQLYSIGETSKEVEESINKEGMLITEWYENNLLLGNFEKYQAMSLGPKNITKDMQFVMSNTEIKQDTELKLLGLTIDDNLNFTNHVGAVCKKASQKVGVLMRLRNMLSIKAKLTIYKSAILPQMTYCHTVWHFCKASDNRKLERIQERALRAVYNNKSDTYEKLLSMANLPNLKNRRLQDIAILMYKVKHGLCPKYIQELFKKNTCSYNFRNSDFVIPRFNSITYGKHSLRYLGPVLWSKLEENIRKSSTIDMF